VSYQSYEGAKPRPLKVNAWAVAALLAGFLVTWVVISSKDRMKSVPDITGSMTFDAEPDTRIYIGNKLVGTGKTSVFWEELLGDERQDPLAIELAGPIKSVNAEWMSGPGAKILDFQDRGGSSSPDSSESQDSYLLRRADGLMDHVIAYQLQLRWADKPRCYLILVRARKGAAGSTISFQRSGSQTLSSGVPGIVKIFGKSPSKVEDFWHFSPYKPPDKYAKEVSDKGFWEPGSP